MASLLFEWKWIIEISLNLLYKSDDISKRKFYRRIDQEFKRLKQMNGIFLVHKMLYVFL